jgi:type IV pilus assembly protein PilV
MQRGAFLLESLIAALVFAFGVLAIAGLHARAVRHANDAQFRVEAVQLAEAALAQMRATAPESLFTAFDTRAQGPGYRALLDRARRLPGVDENANAPEVRVGDGPSAASRQVDITMYWKAPGDDRIHRYDASAVVASR